VPKAYASLEELLADPGVDVVHVTSPNQAHYGQVRDILAAGKHVVCEKPLAMTAAESAEMVGWAKASGRICAVNYNVRFYPSTCTPATWSAAARWATSGSCRGTTSRTGSSRTPTGTGGWSPRRAGRCGPSAISARIGWT
jgi:NAD-dependent oxidoreductase involved in siderophore biosynthesis